MRNINKYVKRKKNDGGNAIIKRRNSTGIPVRNLTNGNDDTAMTIYMKNKIKTNDDQKMTTAFSSSLVSSCAETQDNVSRIGNNLFIYFKTLFFYTYSEYEISIVSGI
tara:strand:- start:55 stop:378 length:324 start_codon:yes stop_codon:yes gene_type:complete